MTPLRLRLAPLLLALSILPAAPALAAGPTLTTTTTTTTPVVTSPTVTPTVVEATPAEARTPITALPFVISASGSYFLTKNLTGSSGKNGIEVRADDVTIDLNGFALVGVAGSSAGIRAFPRGATFAAVTIENLRVVNGTVRGWGARGIDAGAAENAQLSGLRVTRNVGGGVRTGACASIESSTVRDNLGVGIEGSDCTTVRSVSVEGNQGDGIVLGTGGTVASSSACENERGIVVGPGGAVLGSTASRNRADGIHAVDGSTLQHVNASENGGDGIEVHDGSNVSDSVANKNAGSGIVIWDFSKVSDSIAHQNEANGIDIAIGGVATGNQASWNQTGIHVSNASSRVESNHITHNGCGICIEPAGVSTIVTKNTVHANTVMNAGSAHWGGFYDGPYHTPVCPPDTACIAESAPPWANFTSE